MDKDTKVRHFTAQARNKIPLVVAGDVGRRHSHWVVVNKEPLCFT